MILKTNEKLLWDDVAYSRTSTSVEAITGVYALHMLHQVGVVNHIKENSLTVFDNACGAGTVTQELQQLLKDSAQSDFQIVCGDFADAMVESATDRVKREGWSNTTVSKIDAQDTGLPSNHFTHVFTNFGVMLVPNPDNLLSECYRILKPGGVCAFTTWQQVGWIDDLRSAIESIPGLPSFPASMRDIVQKFAPGEWDNLEFIENTMAKHKFADVKVVAIPNTSVIRTSEDIKTVLRACIGIVTKAFWTAEEWALFENASLFENVEKWMRNKYQDGPIEWHWVALVTMGAKPISDQ